MNIINKLIFLLIKKKWLSDIFTEKSCLTCPDKQISTVVASFWMNPLILTNTWETKARQQKLNIVIQIWSRRIIYFNPPFCNSVKTKIGKRFLELISLYFHKNNKFHRTKKKQLRSLTVVCLIWEK